MSTHEPHRRPRTRPRRLSRRGMLGVAAGATAAALLGAAAPRRRRRPRRRPQPSGRGRPVLPPGRLGIQLYTLRDKVSTLGFAPVFAELERYGYDEVEFAGYTQGSAGPITLAQLQAAGTRPRPARHRQPRRLLLRRPERLHLRPEPRPRSSTTPRPSACKHIGTAVGPVPLRHHRRRAGSAPPRSSTPTGRGPKQRGMKFYQHNHAEEFSFATDQPERPPLRRAARRDRPRLVYLEMDIYWAYAGQFRFSKRADGTPAPFEPAGLRPQAAPPLPALPRQGRRERRAAARRLPDGGRRRRRHRLPALPDEGRRDARRQEAPTGRWSTTIRPTPSGPPAARQPICGRCAAAGTELEKSAHRHLQGHPWGAGGPAAAGSVVLRYLTPRLSAAGWA